MNDLVGYLFTLFEANGDITGVIHGPEHSQLLDSGYKLLSTHPGSSAQYPSAIYKHKNTNKILRVSGLNNTGLNYRVIDSETSKTLASHYSAADLLAGRTRQHIRAHAALQASGWDHQETDGTVRVYSNPDYDQDQIHMNMAEQNPKFYHMKNNEVKRIFPDTTSVSTINSYFRNFGNKDSSLKPDRLKYRPTTSSHVTIDWQTPKIGN